MGGAGAPPDCENSSLEVVLSVVGMEVILSVVVVKTKLGKWFEVLEWR